MLRSALADSINHGRRRMEKLIGNIVFTKNRPLQLEAYLKSLYRHMSRELIQTYIIYKLGKFNEQYAELFDQFPDCVVIREQNFHDNFVSLIEKVDTKYILFATDDVVYYESINMDIVDEAFNKFSKDIFGFSLRLDPENLRKKDEVIDEVQTDIGNVYRVNWKKAHSRNAKYPFELNSTIYRTLLVKQILKPVAKENFILKKMFKKGSLLVSLLKPILHTKNFLASIDTFHDPNTLEGYMYRWCKTHKRIFPSYLYFQKLCASAIQVNRVNTSIDNPINGLDEHTVEVLNKKYIQGYRLDIESIEKNKPKETHVGHEYFKLVKR